MAITPTTESPLPTTPDQTQQTYRAAFSIQNPMGVSFEVIGSASKTVKITKLFLNTTFTTVATVNKTSTASSGGTSAAVTAVPLSVLNDAETAVVQTYSAAPTSGAVVGPIAIMSNLVAPFTMSFGDNGSQPLTLVGVNDTIVVNMSIASTGATELLVGYVEWIEE